MQCESDVAAPAQRQPDDSAMIKIYDVIIRLVKIVDTIAYMFVAYGVTVTHLVLKIGISDSMVLDVLFADSFVIPVKVLLLVFFFIGGGEVGVNFADLVLIFHLVQSSDWRKAVTDAAMESNALSRYPPSEPPSPLPQRHERGLTPECWKLREVLNERHT